MPSGTRATDTRTVYSSVGISAPTKSNTSATNPTASKTLRQDWSTLNGIFYTGYQDPRRDEWETKTRSALKKLPLSTLEKETGICRPALTNLREGRSRTHTKGLKKIVAVLRGLRGI